MSSDFTKLKLIIQKINSKLNFQKLRISFKFIALLSFMLILITSIFFIQWLYKLNSEIDSQLQNKRFSPPIEFYTAPAQLFKGLSISPQELTELLKTSNFKQKPVDRDLLHFEYHVLEPFQCSFRVTLDETPQKCFVIRKNDVRHLIALSESNIIIEIFDDIGKGAISYTELEPVLFAQFYGKEPILRTRIELGDTPPICLNAILAIEDTQFLEHQGVSFFGILRAFLRNLFAGRVVQGGSTITQQLVKNYFLTHERTYSRKFKEVFMALLIETKTSKDDILEAYINEIYMGQNGSFQIRGFAAASEYYFGKKLENLNLPECALLAAIVNSPGLFNPFKNSQRALERRNLVLSKLEVNKIISAEEKQQAEQTLLPTSPEKLLSEPAPYFVDAVNSEIEKLGIDTSQGLKIETTLQIKAQEAAQKAVSEGLDRLESNQLKKLKESGKNIEGYLISANPTNGHIQALVGGRSYKRSQFNRAIQAKRHIGSTVKPFIFLAALDSYTQDGENYTPTTLVADEKLTFKYDKQEWSPKNYKNKYYGQIPFYFALKNSLNAASVSIGLQVGIESVLNVFQSAGLTTPVKPLPSLLLGAVELSGLEVLQTYSTLSQIGQKIPLTFIRNVKTLDDEIIYKHEYEQFQALDPNLTSVLVSIMKETVKSGTASAIPLLGFTHPAAGKTGTTDDYKDAWFAGFTPLHSAVVWVGYDDNTAHQLTGGSGAVPIWTNYMNSYAKKFPAIDFNWTQEVVKRTLSVEDQRALNVPEEERKPLSPVELLFLED